MTVNDIYILGAALIGDRENDDLDERHFAVPYSGMAKAADRLFSACAAGNWDYFKTFVPASDPA